MNCDHLEIVQSYGNWYRIDWLLAAKCCRHSAWNRMVLENAVDVQLLASNWIGDMGHLFWEVQPGQGSGKRKKCEKP